MPTEKLKEERYSNFGGMNQKASRYLTSPNEALEIINFDMSRPGSLTKVPGTTQYIGATVSGRIGGFYEFNRLSGASYVITAANTNAYAVSGNSLNAIRTGLTDAGIFDFVTFVDRLFATNGSELWKFDGVNSTLYSLPPGATPTSLVVGSSGQANGMSGAIQYAYGYLNDRGYLGPAINTIGDVMTGSTQNIVNGLTAPNGFGISAIVMYRGFSGGPYYGITFLPPSSTSFTDDAFELGTSAAIDYLYFTMAPQSIELYNNQLFLIGFSGAPSTYYYSEIGEPEGILPESNEEVRTNDGDMLTCGKSYYSQLVLMKGRSVHALSGDDAQNFGLREITDQYGCISKRGAASFEQRLHFLDEKGVCEFDGSDVKIVSWKVEDTFKAMNLPVCRDLAQMLHVKERNEVWTSIAVEGASFLNCIVVYDYVANAWYTRKGVAPAALGNFTGSVGVRSVGFGSFSGSLNYFGASFFSDNGQGMTSTVKFPYDPGAAHSNQKVFRRLWLDIDPTLGATHNVLVNLYSNQSATIALSVTFTQTEFQNRIDFGISAKDLSAQFIFSEDSPLRLNGYTFAHRFQRDV